MKVFLSHSHRAKALVRADPLVPAQKYIHVDRRVRSPDSADINAPIRTAIQEEADFVIVCLGQEAMKSEWVRREFEWTLEREKFLSNFK
ncbi:hypothetical protein C5S32_12195 [ANME-1 cluster archaeon GoMg1]|nr:hypothetical protein [ANME-1 cluster archaeon GoMg1]